MKENDPTRHIPSQFQKTSLPEKQLCIIWETGDMASFLYVHLVSFRLKIEDECGVLAVKFIKERLILKGYNLVTLFWQFYFGHPYILEVTPERYADTENTDQFVITEATVET